MRSQLRPWRGSLTGILVGLSFSIFSEITASF